MSAPASAVDRRPVATVAIVGNDAVLAVAPATPVQLAHACLRRGFSVAVPASWGDELVAAETVRQLASRERGPAVMCVCPFVRARLLAPGPDLAPFLVSLVSPPIATARYLRAAYGDHGVHITYVGACPSADDVSIDERLTPDDFLAQLAEHGIVLSEQPLVFDSVVPPDRRRWSSLPGGVPSAEALSADTDTRTLVEIERDDASTDLAQHIIAREHVLLDLAPGFGCVCSGAVASVAARGARVAVTALEPPRALGPIIDPGAIVSLEVPVGVPALGAGRAAIDELPQPVLALPAPSDPVLEDVLDEMLGLDAVRHVNVDPEREDLEGSDLATTITVDEPLEVESAVLESVLEPPPVSDFEIAIENVPEADVVIVSETSPASEGAVRTEPLLADPSDVAPETVALTGETPKETAHEVADVTEPAEAPAVRRRTPPMAHARYSTATIPKTTSPNGRPLPRAYVAKRRTPPAGAAIIASGPEAQVERPSEGESVRAAAVEAISQPQPDAETPVVVAAEPVPAAVVETTPATEEPAASVDAPSPATEPSGDSVTQDPPPSLPALAAAPATASPAPTTPTAPAASGPVANEPKMPSHAEGGAEAGAGTVAAPAANHGARVFLFLTALVALAVFVLFALRR